MKEKSSKILYMATFPPRECGIATFTQDLTKAFDNKFAPLTKSKIIAMNNNGTNIYNYSDDVIYEISDTDIAEYINTAKEINKKDSIKLVCIQHEFGIFGGEYGSYLIAFLEVINKPVVITFHSVLPKPDEKLKRVVRAIAEKSHHIVVMTEKAISILRKDYDIKTDIRLVPHGIPSIDFETSEREKAKLGYKDRILLSSFGMMSSGKGYEFVIDALPDVVRKYPSLLYIIVGETHPVIRKREGEQYRNMLEKKVKDLGLEKNVKFYNKYVKLSEIISYLTATDIFICSNQAPKQITSGTLVYAMGAGRAVVSTPFLHASDIVNHERGILTEFEDSESFKKAILKVLSNKKLKEKMEKNAYSYTRHMTWPNVALSYMDIFNTYLDTHEKYDTNFPKIKLTHLAKMTDEFGMLQFVTHTTPDTDSGYTLDDNARAMIAACMHYEKFKDESRLKLIKTYMGFIKFVQQEDGRLYNFVDYDRKINKDHWTDDAHGRALWALGFLMSVRSLPLNLREKAEEIFKAALDLVDDMQSPRAVAFTIMGLYYYNKAKPNRKLVSKIKSYSDFLVKIYKETSCSEWKWFEASLTYSNSRLPESLLFAYMATKDKRYLDVALSALDFLISITFSEDSFAPIGHDGWYIRHGHRAHFDQQPVDTASMVQTLILANEITGDKKYLKNAKIAFQWFLGNNALNQVVYDDSTGGCYDGLGKSSVNLNQGAESTISYLLARLSL